MGKFRISGGGRASYRSHGFKVSTGRGGSRAGYSKGGRSASYSSRGGASVSAYNGAGRVSYSAKGGASAAVYGRVGPAFGGVSTSGAYGGVSATAGGFGISSAVVVRNRDGSGGGTARWPDGSTAQVTDTQFNLLRSGVYAYGKTHLNEHVTQDMDGVWTYSAPSNHRYGFECPEGYVKTAIPVFYESTPREPAKPKPTWEEMAKSGLITPKAPAPPKTSVGWPLFWVLFSVFVIACNTAAAVQGDPGPALVWVGILVANCAWLGVRVARR